MNTTLMQQRFKEFRICFYHFFSLMTTVLHIMMRLSLTVICVPRFDLSWHIFVPRFARAWHEGGRKLQPIIKIIWNQIERRFL